ncbi:chemotaxis protein CheW [Desulfuribacillus alkaliarsenatis]|uniref:Chemotaxis protein CheW n=1 Tax=Desulfuribacillus alkaliarsenatis TaxID=766136 RepID=A0A1E5G0C5_9FIRM|nr:chemotaxis protein CheW [Desulfuribacillus alkaliarsenatis]OEF96287.1 chemotaxis protein CheW [Desulfuribacillus alkaliarsenatis]
MKIIIFKLNDEEYGVEIDQVRSIERVSHVTRIPNMADFIKGVINLRGIVTPIIDLRTRFGIEAINDSDNTRVIIISVKDIEIGLVVDAANEVIEIDENRIEPAPKVIGSVEAEFIRGVIKVENRLLILLHLQKVLNLQEKEL